MSLERFDEAFKRKLEAVFPNVVSAYPDTALAESAKNRLESDEIVPDEEDSQAEKNLTVSVPLISFWRLNNVPDLYGWGNDPVTRRGTYRTEDRQPSRVKAYPIKIAYQVDIWSDKRKEVDAIWREILQFLFEEPNLEVIFEGLDLPEEFEMEIINSDNTSDIMAFTKTNNLHRATLTIEVPRAKLLFKDKTYLVKEFPVRIIPVRGFTKGGEIDVQGD